MPPVVPIASIAGVVRHGVYNGAALVSAEAPVLAVNRVGRKVR